MDTEHGACVFSPDRAYRYTLTREWKSGDKVAWIGLNPSTADEKKLDPTLRRVVRFTEDWGFGGFIMLNLFAFRATKPADMKAQDDPVGPNNDEWIVNSVRRCPLVICAWGTHGGFKGRDWEVVDLLSDNGLWGKLHCLEYTAEGHPKHPLYIKGDTQPKPYKWKRGES